MRSMPPTGGATRVTVRPARSSPIAWTVSLSGPLITTSRSAPACGGLAGSGPPRRRRRPRRRSPIATAGSTIRRVIRFLRISSAGGRRVAIRSPGATPPSTIACSLPRLRTVDRRFDELRTAQLVDDRTRRPAGRSTSTGTRTTSGTRSVAMRATAVMPGRIRGIGVEEHQIQIEVLRTAASRTRSRHGRARRCCRAAP